MTIERMTHVVALAPTRESERLTQWLYGAGAAHVAPFAETPEGWTGRFRAMEADPSHAEAHVSRLQNAVGFLREFSKAKGGLLEALFPVRTVTSAEGIARAAAEVDSQKLNDECQRLRALLDQADEKRLRLLAEREQLEQFAFLGDALPAARKLRHVRMIFAAAPAGAAKAFLMGAESEEDVAVASVAQAGSTVTLVLAAPAGEEDKLRALVAEFRLRELALPEAKGTLAQERERLASALAAADAERGRLREEAEKAAARWRDPAELALAHWESERARLQSVGNMVSSRDLFAVRAYVRAADFPQLAEDIQRACPGAALMESAAPQGEEPPVSLKYGPLLRPMGLLVRMFGLPKYDTFDPTPYLTLSFLLFFGICFSDAVYGVMLIVLALWLKKRFRSQPGLVAFFQLFAYAGVSTVIFGFLMGSVAADLFTYFGKDNALDRLRLKMMLLDPLAKPVVAIGIAVGIGVVNQFYGIVLRFLRDVRRGDLRGAIYDGVFWLVYLGSLLAAALSGMGAAPAWLAKPALVLLGLSALGLVLTQGREHKNWAARLVTGLVSLYGIMGTYGTSSFIGDVLSYTRLLALGLTTSIVGMAFNMVASLLKIDPPVIGWVLFAVVCVSGHLFNFIMSVLGAFIHPARLIFLEFFGRFYEMGGKPFRPFGFHSERVEIEGASARR
ncbi:MAG TPA: hypothetical protein P5137_02565 [Candidatus Brocadiia bacterium]|nr:hypothetical protein [Candidatus Brocadiia bacterium]